MKGLYVTRSENEKSTSEEVRSTAGEGGIRGTRPDCGDVDDEVVEYKPRVYTLLQFPSALFLERGSREG